MQRALVLEVVHTMSEEHVYSVYILASRPNGTLYTGVTNNLDKRVLDHREGRGSAFTTKYGVDKLMWFQDFTYVEDAIQLENQAMAAGLARRHGATGTSLWAIALRLARG